MKRTLKFLALVSCLGLVVASQAAPPKKSTPQPHKGGAETTLVGISLFDTGLKVISKYGSPDAIEPVGGGGTAVGPGTGGGGMGMPGMPGMGMPGKGGMPGGVGAPGGMMPPGRMGPGGGPVGAEWIGDPFGTEINNDYQGRPGAMGGMEPGLTGGGGGAPTAGGPGGPGMMMPGAGGKGGGMPGMGGGGGASASGVVFTKWVYNRPSARYAFILDKFNRVVQIEVLGLSDPRVKTNRGAHFGSTFADIIKKYNTPDGYDISGDNLVMRFLVRDRVAFRLSRLGAKKPHQVTGIVVAAGKA